MVIIPICNPKKLSLVKSFKAHLQYRLLRTLKERALWYRLRASLACLDKLRISANSIVLQEAALDLRFLWVLKSLRVNQAFVKCQNTSLGIASI